MQPSGLSRLPGEFRAPKSNRVAGAVGGWQWLCLDHVREFNDSYNFFDGMSPDAIAEGAVAAGGVGARRARSGLALYADPLGVVGGRYGTEMFTGRRAKSGRGTRRDRNARVENALGLDVETTLPDIRRAYKALVRRYHPDSNGGDRSHEAKLQEVVQAYTQLKSAPAFARPA